MNVPRKQVVEVKVGRCTVAKVWRVSEATSRGWRHQCEKERKAEETGNVGKNMSQSLCHKLQSLVPAPLHLSKQRNVRGSRSEFQNLNLPKLHQSVNDTVNALRNEILARLQWNGVQQVRALEFNSFLCHGVG